VKTARFLPKPLRKTAKKSTAVKEMLHVAVVGHVDHGKSELIGRMLHDSGSLPIGRVESVKEACREQGKRFDFAFLLDAFEEEQSQGVSIDTMQIRLKTPRREYVIIDTPGHKEFVKNMISGASYADCALIVIAADEGIKEQSRQHARLLYLLGVEQVGIVVNKMDAVDYHRTRFEKIKKTYKQFLDESHVRSLFFIPVCARDGDNVYTRSGKMRWYKGDTVYGSLRQFKYDNRKSGLPLRMVVQDVYKFDSTRIIAGRVESGRIKAGEEIVFSPSNKSARVKTIEKWSAPKSIKSASSGESIGITLEDQLFVERGEVVSHKSDMPHLSYEFPGNVFWMSEVPMVTGKEYLLRLATQEVPCEVIKIKNVVRVTNKAITKTKRFRVNNNDVAEIMVRTKKLITFDAFSSIRNTGRFVIVDGGRLSGGGTISHNDYPDMRSRLSGMIKSKNISWMIGKVSNKARRKRCGHQPAVLWLTGLPASGKSTLAIELEKRLFQQEIRTYVLDGDNIRHGLNSNLGFSPADRSENIRRISETAKLFCDAGFIIITSFISPRKSMRAAARKIIGEEHFIEVYLECPLEVCKMRDPRGLYKKARAGKIQNFTGVSAPYEIPKDPQMKVPTHKLSIAQAADVILAYLKEKNFTP